MYCLKFTIQPTAAMTFRILPGSILNIATYPFVPPTTLSGFLRRLCMISVGLDIPETRVNNDNPPTYALPPHYLALGAYPLQDRLSGVNRTYRKGMREFNHDVFSRLYIEEEKANFQLHTWEYFIAEELIGYIVSDSAEGLENFQKLENYGCKLGKEGFAIITAVSDIIQLDKEIAAKHPSTIVPMQTLLQSNHFPSGYDIYNLYHYKWTNIDTPLEQEGFLDNQPTNVDGFIPFVAGYFTQRVITMPILEYYTDGNEVNIPVSLVNLLKGEVYV